MLKARGKNTGDQGEHVARTISAINERFPMPDQEVSLWFVEEEFVKQNRDGGIDYASLVRNQDNPTIMVAIQKQSQEEIAVNIGIQYGRYMQWRMGQLDDIEKAVAFGREVAGVLPPVRGSLDTNRFEKERK